MDAKTLRASILQMAIEGKLVPQLDAEPTVEQIGEAPEEVPFEIPEKWKWLHLGDIGKWKAGGTPSRSNPENYARGTIPWLKTGDLTDSTINAVSEYISETGLRNSSAHINAAGSVLIAMYGATIGKIGLLEFPCATNQACCACSVNPTFVYNWYLFYYLLSQRKGFVAQGAGGAQPNISKTKIVNYLIPIPPVAEQHRIVARLNELLPLVDKFGKAQEALTVAQKEFPEKLKSSLLQEAIQGKLVPQLDDEPAVEQIGEAPEDVPFAIPEKWKWEQLDSIFTFIDYRGKTPAKTTSGIRLMTASNVRAGYIDHTRVEYISVEEFEQRKSRGISHKGDILFTTEAPLGFVALADLDTYSAGQRVITLQSNSQTVNTLFVSFLLSPYFQKELRNQATGTTAQGIKAARLKKMWLPVPPLDEQRRIVARLNELLPLVDRMAAQATNDK